MENSKKEIISDELKFIEDLIPNEYTKNNSDGTTEKVDTVAMELFSNIKNLTDVEEKEPEWLLKPYIPKDKLTLIQGDSGVGKTSFICYLASCLSNGYDLMHNPIEEEKNVLMFSVEDGDTVLKQRCKANGGNERRLFIFKEDGEVTNVNFSRIDNLESLIKHYRANVVIFDPFQAFFPSGKNMNMANDTRPILQKLQALATQTSCAIIIIAHTGKNQMNKGIHKSLGSTDIIATVRSMLWIEKNPENKEQNIIVHGKSSNAKKGKSLLYEIVDKGGVNLIGESELTDTDIENAQKFEENKGNYERNPNRQVIKQLISDNPYGVTIDYDSYNTIYYQEIGCYPKWVIDGNAKGINTSLSKLANDSRIIDDIAITFKKRVPKSFNYKGKTIKTPEQQVRCIMLTQASGDINNTQGNILL